MTTFIRSTRLIILSFVLFAFCPTTSLRGEIVRALEGPFVSNVTSNSAVIWWRSSTPLAGEVVIGDRVLPDNEPPFEVMVPDLEPGKPYEYYVRFRDGQRRPSSGTYTFSAAPSPGSQDPFRFAVLCDSRGLHPADPVSVSLLRTLLDHAKSKSVKFVCFSGDLVFGYSRNENEYRRQLRLWKSAAANIMNEIPIYVTMGNHDVLLRSHRDSYGEYDLDGVQKDGRILTSEEVFAEEFVNPTTGPKQPEQPGAPPYSETSYSFDYGNAHFVFINTNYWAAKRTFPHKPGDPHRLYDRGNPEGRIMDGQLAWLRKDLQSARSAGMQHIFIFGHEPAFPVGHHAGDAMHYEGHATPSLKRDIRSRRHGLWKMLREYTVLVAFFGDEHNYSRGLIGSVGQTLYDPPVWQIISGGAGAKLSGKRLMDLPWANSIHVFAKRHHYCLVTVHGYRVSLDVFALPERFGPASGTASFELIDSVPDLTTRR